MTDRRIRLAEAMGWTVDIITDNAVTNEPIESWNSPDGQVSRFSPPDPENNDADCMALVRWLNEATYVVKITHYRNGCDVKVGDWKWQGGVSSTGGDDYKHGVCELALKVIDSKQESDNG